MKNAVFIILTLMVSTLSVLNAQDSDTLCPVDQQEIENNSLLRVFPNPSDGTFQIVYASTTSCPPAGWGGVLMINIINSNLKIVYTETILVFDGEYNQTINLNDQEKGVYIIEMVVGNKLKVKREILK